MHRKTAVVLTLSLLAVIFLLPATSPARIYFFDRKIEITGKIEQKVVLKYHMDRKEKGQDRFDNVTNGGRMKNPAMMKPHLHLDMLAHLYESDETILDFYTLWEWFYDFAPDMRGDIHRGMQSRDRNRYQTPHGLEMVREMYFNFVSGPWTLRVGKQMVVWGETSLQRTADVVNPLDMKSHIMGVDDWEDFKKGLWMFRGFYQTSFVNDLTFEWIWVPNDPKVMDLPREGGYLGTGSYTGGFISNMHRRWKYDERNGHGLHDTQGGIRLRGYNWDWDWTVLWYNGIDAGPVATDWGQRGSRSYKPSTPTGFALHRTGVGGFNLWAAEYNIAVSTGGPLPKFPTTRQFKYYRTNNFGATATKYFENIHPFGYRIPVRANVRTEVSYKPGSHMNKLKYMDGNWLVNGVTQRDLVGYAFEISKDFMPRFITKYNGMRSVDMTLGLYQDWILNHSDDLDVQGLQPRGHGDNSSTTVQLGFSTDWFKQELDTRVTYAHNMSGNGYLWWQALYMPGNHWRFTVMQRYSWSNAGSGSGQSKANTRGNGYVERGDFNNYVLLKIGYQF
jgi:hypothetical protein